MNIEKALINIMKAPPYKYPGTKSDTTQTNPDIPSGQGKAPFNIIAPGDAMAQKLQEVRPNKQDRKEKSKGILGRAKNMFGLSKEKNVEKILPLFAGVLAAPVLGAAKLGMDAIGTLEEIGSAGADQNRAAGEGGFTNSTKSTKKSVEKGLKSHSIHPTHQDPSNPSNHYIHSKRKREAPHQSMAKAFQLEKAPATARTSSVYGNASTIGGNTQARGGITFQTPDRFGSRHTSQTATPKVSSDGRTPNVSDAIAAQHIPDNKAEHVAEFNAYNYTDTLSRNIDDLLGYYGGGRDANKEAEARAKADADLRALQGQAAQAQIDHYGRNGSNGNKPEGNWWDDMSQEDLADWLSQYEDPLSQYEDYQPEQKNIE